MVASSSRLGSNVVHAGELQAPGIGSETSRRRRAKLTRFLSRRGFDDSFDDSERWTAPAACREALRPLPPPTSTAMADMISMSRSGAGGSDGEGGGGDDGGGHGGGAGGSDGEGGGGGDGGGHGGGAGGDGGDDGGVACARGTASQPGQSVIWAQAHAWATRPLNVTSCTCICAESQEVTWSPPHAQLPGETSSVDSVQASSVELLTSVADDAGGGGHGGGAGGEVAQVAAVLPSWMASQIVSQMVSQRGGDVSQRGGDVSLRGGEDRLPGRWWYGILTTKSGSENNLGSTCPIRGIRSVTCRCPGQLAGCWQSVIRSLLHWSVPCSQTREASCPTGYASQSEISSGGTRCGCAHPRENGPEEHGLVRSTGTESGVTRKTQL